MTMPESDINDCADILGAADTAYHGHDYAQAIAQIQEAQHHPGWHGLSQEVKDAAASLDQRARGMQAYTSEQWDDAIMWLNEAANSLPTDMAREFYRYLGVCFMHKGDLESAVKWWEAAGFSDPNWPSEYEDYLKTL